MCARDDLVLNSFKNPPTLFRACSCSGRDYAAILANPNFQYTTVEVRKDWNKLIVGTWICEVATPVALPELLHCKSVGGVIPSVFFTFTTSPVFSFFISTDFAPDVMRPARVICMFKHKLIKIWSIIFNPVICWELALHKMGTSRIAAGEDVLVHAFPLLVPWQGKSVLKAKVNQFVLRNVRKLFMTLSSEWSHRMNTKSTTVSAQHWVSGLEKWSSARQITTSWQSQL